MFGWAASCSGDDGLWRYDSGGEHGRPLEPDTRVLRNRRGGRGLLRGRRELYRRGGDRAELPRPPERAPADPAPAVAGLRRLDGILRGRARRPRRLTRAAPGRSATRGG